MTLQEAENMKSLERIQSLHKLGRILSKLAFVFAVIGVCGCIAGLLSLRFGSGSLLKFGGVTIHGLIAEGYNAKSIGAALSGWIIVCAGEAVLASFAAAYFKKELEAGTPFTLNGARELLRLSILTMAIPLGCAVAGKITQGVVGSFLHVTKDAAIDLAFGNGGSMMLGIAFLVTALLCRYGAELREGGD